MNCISNKYYTVDNLELTLNDDFYQLYQLTDDNGAVDITGYVIKFAIKENQTTTTKLIESTATLSTPLEGYFTVYIPSATLFPLLGLNKTYYYSIEITDLLAIKQTRIKGELKISWEGA